ncbi:MAG: hypothetical protein ABR514_00340 [Chthoniobacterales bacterium]
MRGARGAVLWWGIFIIVSAAAVDYLTIDTQRLLLDRRMAADDLQGAVAQQFVQKGTALVPEIVSSRDSRFSFAQQLSMPHELLLTIVPDSASGFELNVIENGHRRRLVSESLNATKSYRIRLSSLHGVLEFVSRGKITWVDPQISRIFSLWPLYAIVLGALATAIWQRRPSLSLSTGAANWLTLAGSVGLTFIGAEIFLRSVGTSLPRAILEVRPDAGPTPLLHRWMSSPRYQMRLRPNVRTYTEWRFGDIVQLGIVDQEAASEELHRFYVESDAEGFSNQRVRDKIDIAALGDSFTEGWVVPAAQAWPARLEKTTLLAVQNYGVPAFAPQQELYALEDFALKHRPHFVVMAFFAGNDLSDAVSFDRRQRHRRFGTEGDSGEVFARGARIPESYRNYEKLYLWSAGTAAAQSIAASRTRLHHRTRGTERLASERAGFEKGIFHTPIRGRKFNFAWMPPHLFQLAMPRWQVEQSPGWRITRNTLQDINSTCRENGAQLVLMFIPPAPEIEWPLAEQAVGRAELERAIDFYFSAWNRMLASPPNVGRGLVRVFSRFPAFDRLQMSGDAVRANRLALNELIADFCRHENISFLDLTAALQKQVESGVAVYFPDDEHWNAAGHETAARELARFLKDLP